MKRLLLILALLCGVVWSQDQLPTPIQSCGSTGVTCAFNNNVVSGNFIFIGGHSEGALTTPTDTRSTTWTLVDSNTNSSNTYIWCGVLGSSGAETITLTGSLSFEGQVSFEFAPFAGMTCTKDTSVNGHSSATNTTTSAITTTKNGDLMLCYMSNFSSSGMPQPTGSFNPVQTQRHSDSSGMAFLFAGTNGSQTCSFTSTDTSSGYVLAAFKPSAITLVTSSIPHAVASRPFSYQMQAVGGSGAYTWSKTAGAWPAGISISSGGLISGTPTSGTTTPTIQVSDGSTSTSAAFTFTVNATAGTVTLVQAVNTTTQPLTAVAVGDVLVLYETVLLSSITTNTLWPPTDTLGTVYKNVGLKLSSAVGADIFGEALYIGIATSSGSDTITAVTAFVVDQYTNAQFSLDVIGNAGGNTPGTATLSGAALTTLASGSEISAGGAGYSSTTVFAAGSGFTLGSLGVSSSPQISEHANESSIGTYTPQVGQTNNGDGNWAIWDIALRPSTSGVVNTNHRRAWVIER